MTPLVEKLADHIEKFDCSVYVDGRLKLFMEIPPSGKRRCGILVGQVQQEDWKIEKLEWDAPDYLKLLVGQSFAGQNLLKAAVRKAAFVAEFKALCG